MSKMNNQALGFWRDKSGATATTFTVLANQTPAIPGGVSAIVNAMAALSRCALDGMAYQNAQPATDTPEDGSYPSVADRAVFILEYADSRQLSRIEIPAPKDTIFVTGSNLVDMSNSAVITFVNALLANAGNGSGGACVNVRQGNRQGVKRGPF